MLKLSLHLQVLPEQVHHHSLHVTPNTTPVPAEAKRSNLALSETVSALCRKLQVSNTQHGWQSKSAYMLKEAHLLPKNTGQPLQPE